MIKISLVLGNLFRKLTISKIQTISSIVCMGIVVAVISLPMAVYESQEHEVDSWMRDFPKPSFRVLLFPREFIEAMVREERQSIEGMSLFAPPDVPQQVVEQNVVGNADYDANFTSARLAALRALPNVDIISWARSYSDGRDLYLKGNSFIINLVAPEFFELVGMKIADGRGPTNQDPDQVAVVGDQVARLLFGNSGAVGKCIIPEIGDDWKELTIIGVLAPAEGVYEQWREDYDRAVYILDREPIDVPFPPTIQSTGSNITDIWIGPKPGHMDKAMEEVREYLQKEVGPGSVFYILTNRESTRLIGGIQARQAYLPFMNWVIGVVLFVAALNIAIVVYLLMFQKRYVVGIKRSIGVSKFKLFFEEMTYLLPKGAVASVLGILIALVLAPKVGAALQSNQFFDPIPVVVGPYTIIIGFAAGIVLWCVVAIIALFVFLQRNPADLLRERYKSFTFDRKGQVVSGAGIAISVLALLVILGLRDGTSAQFDRILGWSGGEKAGAIIDWMTIDAPSGENPAELSSDDYLILKNTFPQALFGWLGRTGGLPGVEIVQASASMSEIRPPVMAAGRWFSAAEEARQAHVAVLGRELGAQLANKHSLNVSDMIGQTWRSYRIVGVMDDWPARYSMGYRSDVAYVPVGAQEKGAGIYYYRGQIAFLSPTNKGIEAFVDEVRQVLEPRHPEGKLYFVLAADKISIILSWRLRMYSLMGAFAAFSFIIGGLGIMNILFMWVVSHWREIGIRRACGAGQSNILLLVFYFSVLLTVSATFFGSLAGTFIAILLQIHSGWPVTVYPYWLAVSFGVALISAGVFGGLPAIWASRQQPANLLRME
jgi:putative ABC transport system permease protein